MFIKLGEQIQPHRIRMKEFFLRKLKSIAVVSDRLFCGGRMSVRQKRFSIWIKRRTT